jgi:hypothetical protein
MQMMYDTGGVKNLLTKVISVKVIKDIVMDPSISEDKGKEITHKIDSPFFKRGEK